MLGQHERAHISTFNDFGNKPLKVEVLSAVADDNALLVSKPLEMDAQRFAEAACAAFAHYVISIEDRQRAGFVLRAGAP